MFYAMEHIFLAVCKSTQPGLKFFSPFKFKTSIFNFPLNFEVQSNPSTGRDCPNHEAGLQPLATNHNRIMSPSTLSPCQTPSKTATECTTHHSGYFELSLSHKPDQL